MEWIAYIVFLVTGCTAGYFVFGKNNQNLKAELDRARESLSELKVQLATAEARIIAFDEAQETARIEFRNVASEVLKKNSKEFEEQSKKTIETITTPLKKI